MPGVAGWEAGASASSIVDESIRARIALSNVRSTSEGQIDLRASAAPTAAAAASAPLLLGPGADRSRACSGDLAVRMPNVTGTPVSSATRIKPSDAL